MSTAVESEEKSAMLAPLKVVFIGGGQMGTALTKGILDAGKLAKGSQIWISDPYLCRTGKKHPLSLEFPEMVVSTSDNQAAISGANVVILAVKPQILSDVMRPLKESWSGEELVISIAAGITLDTLQSFFDESKKQSVIRVMPNTPALVGCMAGGYALGEHATSLLSESDESLIKGLSDERLLQDLLGPLGVLKKVKNDLLLDAVSGVAGCSPAYTFMFIESLADGAVKMGLPRSDAYQLAAQAVLGSAKMVLETGKHPGQLKDAVCSPGGATIVGLSTLEKSGFRSAVIEAVADSTKRCTELGKPQSSL